MQTLRSENFAEQFGRAIGYQMVLGEVGGRIDQACQLDDTLDAIQIATAGRLQRSNQVDRDGARSLLAFFGRDVLAQLTDPWLAVFLGNMTRQKYSVAGLYMHHVGSDWRRDGWQFDIEGFEFFVKGQDGLRENNAIATHGWMANRLIRWRDFTLAGRRYLYALSNDRHATADSDHCNDRDGEQDMTQLQRLAQEQGRTDQGQERLQQLHLTDTRDAA